MGWEKRGRSGKLYFYRSERAPDGRVVKRYVANRSVAELTAHALAERRRLREHQERLLRDDDRRTAGARRAADVSAAAVALSAAALLAAGYTRTNYGPWRKKRHG